MFNQRTYGYWKKIKALLDEGELGRLVRTTWIITDWFRSQHYFDSGGWRATWKGEGGGVLLNQCPHQLDLFQWLVGMPDRVTGFASLGKYHAIEVEDEVTAYFEYRSGAVGHFITTTAESPGTNRLEIVGENGRLVFENGELVFHRNRSSMLKFLKASTASFDKVECWQIKVPFQHHGEGGHRFIIQNFVEAVLDGAALIAPAAEGLNSVLMANAIMHSSFNGHRAVELPMDEAAFAKELQDRVNASAFTKKTAATAGGDDMAKSFGQEGEHTDGNQEDRAQPVQRARASAPTRPAWTRRSRRSRRPATRPCRCRGSGRYRPGPSGASSTSTAWPAAPATNG